MDYAAVACRVLRSGAVPAFGQGLALPKFDADAVSRLTPVARRRGSGDGDGGGGDGGGADAATPLAMPPSLRPHPPPEGGDARTPELGRPPLRQTPAKAQGRSPLDSGGLSELEQLLAKRRGVGADS
jgi:hypothetical protein